MKWKTKEHVGHKTGELRIKSVFTWWPRSARKEGERIFGNEETRWFSFNLLQQTYYSGSFYDTTNIFGAKTTGFTPSFWGSDRWDNSRKLTIKEKAIALRNASCKAVLFLSVVGLFTCWIGYSGYRIYDGIQNLKRIKAEQSQGEVNQRGEEQLEKLKYITGD